MKNLAARKWKAIQGFGCLSSLAGVALFFLILGLMPPRDQRTPQNAPIGMATACGALFILGIPLYWIGRAGVWWHRD